MMVNMTGSIEDYLANEEDLILSFGAESVGEDNTSDWDPQSTEYSFGATDRRLVYLGTDGSFKDIEYRHISSIETETETETDINPGAIGAIIGGLAIVLGISGLAQSGNPPIVAVLSILIGGPLLIWGISYDHNPDPTEKQNITIITGDEADQQLEMTTAEDVGAELSGIVREHG
jgi:hypothetical protein